MQVALLEVNVLGLDLGHLAHTQPGSGQQEKDASLSIVPGSLQQDFELRGGQKFLGLHARQDRLILLQISDYTTNRKLISLAADR
jgi:hypothetical protein